MKKKGDYSGEKNPSIAKCKQVSVIVGYVADEYGVGEKFLFPNPHDFLENRRHDHIP